MKLLLSGITGFIGEHLTARLLADGHELIAIAKDQDDKKQIERKNIQALLITGSDLSDLRAKIKSTRVDGCIHLASCFLVNHKTEDIPDLMNSNILFSTQLLELAVKSDIPWFLNTGTFWQHYNNQPYSPVNLYAATKEAFITIARFYQETSNINFITIKLNDTYGPGDKRPKIFNLWKKAIVEKQSLEMSPGEQLIDITYIDDVVEAYVKLINLAATDKKRVMNGKSFAVSSGKVQTLKDLARIYEKSTGQVLAIQWGKKAYRAREVMVPWDKGEPVPGWKPKVSLAEGIVKTFADSPGNTT